MKSWNVEAKPMNVASKLGQINWTHATFADTYVNTRASEVSGGFIYWKVH